MLEAQIFALSSAVLSGFSAVLLRVASKQVKPIVVNFLKLLGASLSLLILTGFNVNLSISASDFLIVLFITLSGPVLAWYLYVKALRHLPVSQVHPVVNTYPLVAIALALVTGFEEPKVTAFVAAFLVVLSIKMLYKDKQASRDARKYAFLPLCTAFLWGLNTYLFGILLKGVSAFALTVVRAYLATFFTFLLVLPHASSLKTLSKKSLCACLLAGVLSDNATFFLWLTAISLGGIAVPSIISSTAPIFSAILAHLILKERLSPSRLTGVILAVLGVAILFI